MTVVPSPPPAAAVETPGGGPLEPLAGLVAGGGLLVLSGAGLSTESGIPDYRGPTGALRRHTPMTFQAFLRDPGARRRYWALSRCRCYTIISV